MKNIKKIFAMLLCISMLCSATAYAVENDIVETIAETYSDKQEESSVNELKIEDNGVSLAGYIPEGTELNIEKVDSEQTEVLQNMADLECKEEDVYLWTQFYYIKADVNGEAWQPDETVEITIEDVYCDEVREVEVRHYFDTPEAIRDAIAEGTALFYTASGLDELFPIETSAMQTVDSDKKDTICYEILSTKDGSVLVRADGTITFETTSFSIYQVSETFAEDKTRPVADGSTLEIFTDDTIYLRWDHDDTLQSDVRGVWAITSGTDVIELTTYNDKRLEGGECKCDGVDGYPKETHESDCGSLLKEEPTKCDCAPVIVHASTCPQNDAQSYQFWYAKIIGLKPGESVLTFTYRNESSNTNADIDEDKRVIKTVNINVKDSEFRIEDQVALNGCLVPMGSKSPEIVKYEWSKSIDGVTVEINPDALDSNKYAVANGVNIAIDKGGITNSDRRERVYTVKGYDVNGNCVAQDSFVVKYGREVINGSFELPVIQTSGTSSIHRQFPNGEPGLYWMTTGLGAVRNDLVDMLGHDIEIFSDITGRMNTTYSGITQDTIDAETGEVIQKAGLNVVRNGHQAAELNCEEYGALYQDVITAPGATLNWSVAHAARYPNTRTDARHSNDHMCVIIMPTEDAKLIINKDDMDLLFDAAGYNRSTVHDSDNNESVDREESVSNCDCGLPAESQGKQFTIDDFKGSGKNISFYIYDCEGSYDKWTDYSGQYNVPENQYLTRFFFAAAVSITNNLSGGNFVDSVNFSEDLGYTIEYYTQDTNSNSFELKSTLTESGIQTVYSTASASNINDELLNEYFLSYTTLNDAAFGKETSFIVQPSNQGEAPILRLFFIQKGIDITKDIRGINPNLSGTEMRMLLANYSVTIDLYSDKTCTNKVASATMSFYDGTTSKTTMFVDCTTGKQFIPEANTTYWVKEDTAPALKWYDTVTTVPVVNAINTNENAIGSGRVINEYSEIVIADLTIEKKVTDAAELALDENQTFVFKLEGLDENKNKDIKYDTLFINGEGDLTIKALPIGRYMITELTNWSWRYELDSISAKILGDQATIDMTSGTIIFELTPDGEIIVFQNDRQDEYWLSGDSYCENWWGGTGETTIVKRNGRNEEID